MQTLDPALDLAMASWVNNVDPNCAKSCSRDSPENRKRSWAKSLTGRSTIWTIAASNSGSMSPNCDRNTVNTIGLILQAFVTVASVYEGAVTTIVAGLISVLRPMRQCIGKNYFGKGKALKDF